MTNVEICIDLFPTGGGDPAQFEKRLALGALPAKGELLCVGFFNAEVQWVRLVMDPGSEPFYDIRASHTYTEAGDLDHLAAHLTKAGWVKLG